GGGVLTAVHRQRLSFRTFAQTPASAIPAGKNPKFSHCCCLACNQLRYFPYCSEHCRSVMISRYPIQRTKGFLNLIELRTSPLDPMPRQTSPRLIFVDDEESIRLTLAPILRERGFDVFVTGSVHEAVSRIRAES